MNTSRHGAPPSGPSCAPFATATLSLVLLTAACTSIFTLGQSRSDTRVLAGVWVDSVLATPTDTLAWKLDANGANRTLEIHVIRDSAMRVTTKQREQQHGHWYLRGALADTAGRALCFKARPRDGGICYRFQLDTLAKPLDEGHPPRRLLVAGYPGRADARTRVLVERLP